MKLKQKTLLILAFFPFYTWAQFVDERQATEELGTGMIVNKVDDVVNIFLAIIFITSVFGFIFSGVQYIIAGGNERVLESARKTRNVSIIGSSLALVAYVIIKLMQFLLG